MVDKAVEFARKLVDTQDLLNEQRSALYTLGYLDAQAGKQHFRPRSVNELNAALKSHIHQHDNTPRETD